MVVRYEPQANEKVFRCSSFLKMLPRCGRAAHICEANWILQLCFPAAIAFLKLSNSNKVVSWESRLQIQTRQRGNCSMLAGKSRGGTPFCRMRKTVFPKKNVSREILLLGKPPESGSARLGHIPSLPRESQLPLKPYLSLQPLDLKGNCDSLRFSPRFYLRILVQFDLLRKCGLLAHTSPTFLKNCWIKKLLCRLRLVAYS